MGLRVSQPYQSAPGAPATTDVPLALACGNWPPLVVSTKLMRLPNYNTRTQVAPLVETAVPGTRAPALKQAHWAPAAHLLVSR